VDGVLENFAPTNNERLDDNPTIVLGGNTLDSRYFNGVIDEAAVYDRALSDSEVLVHFLAGTDRLPTPEDDTRETSEGVPVEVRVLNNDSDPDNDPLTIVSFSTPANGSVSINDNETPDDATDDFLIYTPNVGFVGTDVFTYEVGDGRGGSASATVSVTVGASVPVVFAGGDAVLNEGDVFTRSGFFEDTGIGPWTATVDFGDGSGTQAVALNADHSFQFEHLFADSGSFNVFVAVTDEAGNVGSSSFVVTVNNVAPEAGVSGPAQGVRGQTLVFQVSASDVSPADQDAGFTYLVDWGDGSAVQRIEPSPGNGAGVGLEHVFTARGHYTVQVTAIDQDGDRSTTTHTVVVKAAALQADPLHPGKNMLVVGGTTGRDTIYLLPGANNRVKVVVNGVSLGSFRAQTRLVVFAQGGDDYVEVSSSISKSAWLFGDDGNDVLKGGSGRDVLVGGAGQDVLRGGWGRDLLIGGAGGDRLHGDARGDLILAGSVAFEANDAALAGVLAEWASGRDYQTRVANLRGQGSGPRLNGNFFLQVGGEFATVFDDGVRDCLTGGCGRDWFFAHLGRGVQDRLIDRGPGEAVDELL
jgi:Ca2+-binding RTX toxin-like protein